MALDGKERRCVTARGVLAVGHKSAQALVTALLGIIKRESLQRDIVSDKKRAKKLILQNVVVFEEAVSRNRRLQVIFLDSWRCQ